MLIKCLCVVIGSQDRLKIDWEYPVPVRLRPQVQRKKQTPRYC